MVINKLIEDGKKILNLTENYSELLGYAKNGKEMIANRSVIYSKNYTKWSLKAKTVLQRSSDEKFLNKGFESLFDLDDEFIEIVNFKKAINILEAIEELCVPSKQKIDKSKNNLLNELDRIITEGKKNFKSNIEFDEIEEVYLIYAENYTKWSLISKSFLQHNCSEKSLKEDFESLFDLLDDFIEKTNFEKAIGVLEAIRETDSIKIQELSKNKDTLLEELEEFINIGNNFYGKLGTYDNYVSTSSYIKWSERVIPFLQNYCLSTDYIEEFERIFSKKKSNINKEDFLKGVKILELVQEKKLFSQDKTIKNSVKKPENKKIEKIFISHASKDVDYIKLFVQLLNNIGIPKSSNKIFCSSLEGYNIPLDHDIYEHIKSQFDGNIRVIFMLSKNYYNSVACLNEMGATWVKAKDYTTIFLPDFIPENIKGAINSNQIGFYLNDYEKLNTFRDKIIKEFDLKAVDHSIWERDRNKFIEEIQNLMEQKKSNNSTSDVEMKIESVEEDHEGNNILLCARIINNSQFNYKLKEFDLFLTDTKDEKEEITHKEHLEIYSYENRIVNFQLPKRNQNFKGNRTKDKKIDPIFTK